MLNIFMQTHFLFAMTSLFADLFNARIIRGWTLLFASLVAAFLLQEKEAKAFSVIHCNSNPSNVCGVSGITYNSHSFAAKLASALASDIYGSSGEFLDVHTHAEASALMDVSASAINSFVGLNYPVSSTPPFGFGESGETEYKIAYSFEYVAGHLEYVLGSLSEWRDVGGYWQIVRSDVAWPAGVPNTWVKSVPGPLPLLGAGAAFGFSRKLRRRVKAFRMA
jgi:hypothetical protein